MTVSISKSLFAVIAAAAALSLPGFVSAQGGFVGVAPPGAIDQLSGISQPSAAGPVGRARSAATGQPVDPFAAPGAGGAAIDPFGGGAAAVDPFGGAGGAGGAAGGGFVDPFGAQGFNAQQQSFQPQIPTVEAIYGTRVIDAVSKQVLSDAKRIDVFQTFVEDFYYDDGQTAGDYRADDLVYTNVDVIDNVMSPEAQLVKTRLIRGFETLESLEPNEFFNETVASSDPLADVPQILRLEEERDEFLMRWADQFLADFRVEPDEAKSTWDFYEVYLPSPPRLPNKPLPVNFLPPNINSPRASTQGPAGFQAGAAGGGGFNGTAAIGNAFGTNNIQSNAGASSSYFGGGGFQGAPGGAPVQNAGLPVNQAGAARGGK